MKAAEIVFRYLWNPLGRAGLRRLLTLTLVIPLLGIGTAQAKRHGKKTNPPKSVPDRINALAQQLDDVQLADAGSIPQQIQKLVLDSLESWMSRNAASGASSRYPFDVQVRMQLENYFSKLHYPFFGRPAVAVKPWNGGQLIAAGYTFGWSDFDRVNCVALFQRKAGTVRMAAVTNFVPQTDLHYAFLPPSPAGDFRLIIYGNKLGKSQPRLTAILYSFDGNSLKNLWEKQDLYNGKIEVTPQTVTLRYLVEREYIQAVEQGALPPGHEAIYAVTPEGLTLQTEHQIPFKSVS
jgi:hypothetical protein